MLKVIEVGTSLPEKLPCSLERWFLGWGECGGTSGHEADREKVFHRFSEMGMNGCGLVACFLKVRRECGRGKRRCFIGGGLAAALRL
jgi:hypothetical protein